MSKINKIVTGSFKRWFGIGMLCCLIVLLAKYNVHALSSADLREGEFVINAKGQNIDLIANSVKSEKLLQAISEKIGVKLKFHGEKRKSNLLTLNFKNKPLDFVLRKILGTNYVLTYKGSKVANMSSINLRKRIATANEEFSRLVEETPNKVISAATFFSHGIPPEQLLDEIQGTNLQVKSFRHGTQDYSGGYTLQPDESYDEAVSKYREMHLAFLQEMGQELGSFVI